MPAQNRQYNIAGRVTNASTGMPVPGLRVEAWDRDLIRDDPVGVSTTDGGGNFSISLDSSRLQELFKILRPDLYLKVFKGDKLIKNTRDSVRWNIESPEQTFEIAVELPPTETDDPGRRAGSVSLADVVRAAGGTAGLLEALRANQIMRVEDLFSARGMEVVRGAGVTNAEHQRLLTVAKFSVASGSVSLGSRLLNTGVATLSQLGRVSPEFLVGLLGRLDAAEEQAVARLYYTARAVHNMVTSATFQFQHSTGQDATWYTTTDRGILDGVVLTPYVLRRDFCDAGESPFNVFSPVAYILDLLRFISDNWAIGSERLEGLFRQEIDGLDCEGGLRAVPQIHLGIEVLQKYLGPGRLPLQDAEWTQAYKASVETILTVWSLSPESFPQAARSDLASTQPDLSLLERVVAALRERRVETTPDQERRDSVKAEAEALLSTIFSPLLMLYRQKLIQKTGEPVERLESRLFIDLQSPPAQLTNRVTQVIQSLQSFVLAVRTGDIGEHPDPGIAGLFAREYGFDEASWNWLAEYATWSSAMYTLVYPENVMSLPPLRASATYGFKQAVSSVPQPITRESAATALKAYDAHLETLSLLTPVSAHVLDSKLYLFAHGFVNIATLPARTWSGWKPMGDVKDDLNFLGTALLTEGDKVVIIAAFTKWVGDKWESIKLFRVSDEGLLKDSPSLPEVPAKINGVDMGPLTLVRRFETIEFSYSNGNSLVPAVTVALRDRDTARFIFERLDRPPRLIQERPAGLTDSGVLIDHNYYEVRKPSDWPSDEAKLILKRVDGQPFSHQFEFDSDRAEDDPRLWTGAEYVLATNHRGDETYLFSQTLAGSILCRTIKPEEPELTGEWTAVSPAPMEAAFRTLLGGPSNQHVPLFLRQTYFEERYLHFPLYVAWGLNRAGDYAAAHDWYRKLYDPFGRGGKYGFPFDSYFKEDFSRPESWLSDPLDSYSIATRRRGVYLRHTVLMMVKNLLDWADHEFARSGPESLNRARELYLLARRILKAPVLSNPCHDGLNRLRITIQKSLGVNFLNAVTGFNDLYQINNKTITLGAAQSIQALVLSNQPPAQISRGVQTAVSNALTQARQTQPGIRIGELFRSGQENNAKAENVILTSNPVAVSSNTGGIQSFFSPTLAVDFSIPPNPLLKAFSFNIEACLAKLHASLNLAGDWTPQTPAGAAGAGRVSLSSAPARPTDELQPPRYRYNYLAEKARQQAAFAQQLGAALLQAIEKKDAAAYERLQAQHAIDVARATVTLKSLSEAEASTAKRMADQQVTRAGIQFQFWNGRLNSGYSGGFLGFGVGGLNEAELIGMGLTAASGALQLGAAAVYSYLAVPAMIAAAAGGVATTAGGIATVGGVIGGNLSGHFTPPAWVSYAVAGAGVGMIGAGVVGGSVGMLVGGGQFLGSALQSAAGAVGTFGSLGLTIASFQRRWEDWKLQYDLANVDQAIANLQVTLAQDRVNIASQDRQVADLHHAHAVEVLNFLKAKFSNEELYQWMRDVLIEQYRTVMQIATSTALLAQHSLEFERQEVINIVTNDYWSADTGTLSASGLTAEQKSVGILGAERLLTALARLDDNKLQKDQRHLQISKTISLARLLPTEFYELKQNGKITFNTLMEWFDWDFPGHYLRLIKSVKVSILALVPPVDGIHAMLSSGGVSSVVVPENSAFVKRRSLRTYGETVALDSAYNESGLFVLDYNDPMLLPFEGLGVEAEWTLELPRATNRFDFGTIADVLFTIEYTALHDRGYEAQVKKRLGTQQRTGTYLDLRQFFPDEWYHLKNPKRNPDGSAAGQEVLFDVPASLFPPNLADIRLRHVMLIVVGNLKGADADETSRLRQTLTGGLSVTRDGVRLGLVPVQFKDTYAVFSTSTAGAVQEFWYNVPGVTVSAIPQNRPPDDFQILPKLQGAANKGERYGSRIRGYLRAPATGGYTFWLTSDDQSEFFLSTDSNPANLRPAAKVSTWSWPPDWNKEPSQKSAQVTLTAGQRYYFEVLHKQGPGADHVAVGWLKPGESGTTPSEIIPGSHLSLFTISPAENLSPYGKWTLQTGREFYVTGMSAADRKSLADRVDDIIIVLTVEGAVRWST